MQSMYEPDSYHITMIEGELAKIYAAQGRYEEAEEIFKQAIDTVGKILGQHHPAIADYLTHIAILKIRQSHYDDALHFMEKAMEGDLLI